MAQSHTVPVRLATGSYNIHVKPGLLAQLGAVLRNLTQSTKAAILTDSNVSPLHLPAAIQSLQQAGFEPVVATIPAGEEHKNLKTLLPVYDQFLASQIERSTPVLSLGGGVVGDMTGLVAGTLLRGVPFVQVPTTLLAMVDASVGGKTGVDHTAGKNLIGVFHQPIAVVIDPLVLGTLPLKEMRGGLAECIKHDIIRDATGFAHLEANLLRVFAGDTHYLTDLIAHNVAIKARVVEADPFEKGERAHLNLGHTFGHAIEAISNFRISHGEAVGLGLVAAADVAVAMGLLADVDRARIVALVAKAGLPTGGHGLDIKSVCDAMLFDKKVRGGKVRFVLPDGIGQAVIRDDVPAELVRNAVQKTA